ncbi:hypothetical protein NMG60_11006064 [Bertholletia excelsa]
MKEASRVFDGMKAHDQVSWTSIMSGFSQNGHGREAFVLFKEIDGMSFECGMSLHAHLLKLGSKVNTFVVSSVIDCYLKCSRVEQAAQLFEATAERDIVLFNSMISGYSQNLYGEDALKLFIQMQKENISPTDHTLTSILNTCGNFTVLQEGRQLHALVTKLGPTNNIFVACALVDMHSKRGCIDEARCIFNQTVERNSVLWTSMISGYAQNGRGSEASELFGYLVREEGFAPDHVCFTAVLTACTSSGFLDRGIGYFNKMRRDYGLVPEMDNYACLIDIYARNGLLTKAREVFGEVELAREAAFELCKIEPHSAVPYIMLANIYGGAGFWREMDEVRKLMELKEIKKSTGWSWVEVGKKVHFFSMGDRSHPQSPDIYAELETLNCEMREARYMPTFNVPEKKGKEVLFFVSPHLPLPPAPSKKKKNRSWLEVEEIDSTTLAKIERKIGKEIR